MTKKTACIELRREQVCLESDVRAKGNRTVRQPPLCLSLSSTWPVFCDFPFALIILDNLIFIQSSSLKTAADQQAYRKVNQAPREVLEQWNHVFEVEISPPREIITSSSEHHWHHMML